MGDKKMINLNNEKRNQAMSLRGRAVGSDVVIFHAKTEKALSLSGALSEPIMTAESKENQPRYSVNCCAIPEYDRFGFGFAKVLAFAFFLSFNLSPSFAADCVPETTTINSVEKPLVTCNNGYMYKYTYDSSGNLTNETAYNSEGSGWKKGMDEIYTYDSSGNLESKAIYWCYSGNCEQGSEYKYKLDTLSGGTKIVKEIMYSCSDGVCEKSNWFE